MKNQIIAGMAVVVLLFGVSIGLFMSNYKKDPRLSDICGNSTISESQTIDYTSDAGPRQLHITFCKVAPTPNAH